MGSALIEMGQRAGARALLLTLGGLLCAAAAAGAPGEVSVHEPRWEISVNGHEHLVEAGGKLRDCPGEGVESITALVTLTPGATHGTNYEAVLVGPKAVGTSDAVERHLEGRRALLEVPFRTIEFSKLSFDTNVSSFPPGPYSFQLAVPVPGKKPAYAPVETLALVRGKKAC